MSKTVCILPLSVCWMDELKEPSIYIYIVTTGEEDEDTVFQARSKLFVNEKGWKERGVGLLKLNVQRSDGSGARLGAFSVEQQRVAATTRPRLMTFKTLFSDARRRGSQAAS